MNKCSSEEDLQYRLEIRNANGEIVKEIEDCEACMNGRCLCSTSDEFRENYTISVTAFNSFGSSPPAISEIIGIITLKVYVCPPAFSLGYLHNLM